MIYIYMFFFQGSGTTSQFILLRIVPYQSRGKLGLVFYLFAWKCFAVHWGHLTNGSGNRLLKGYKGLYRRAQKVG